MIPFVKIPVKVAFRIWVRSSPRRYRYQLEPIILRLLRRIEERRRQSLDYQI
jgi:hypothetical protein